MYTGSIDAIFHITQQEMNSHQEMRVSSCDEGGVLRDDESKSGGFSLKQFALKYVFHLNNNFFYIKNFIFNYVYLATDNNGIALEEGTSFTTNY